MEYLSWGGLSKLHSLPVTRIATLLPAIGYLILFSEAIPDLSNYVEIDDNTHWFSAGTRLKLLYFGGTFIAASMILHFCFCPSMPKRFRDRHDLRDNFVRSGSPLEVAEALLECGSKAYLFKGQRIYLEGLQQHIKSYFSTMVGGRRVNEIFESEGYQKLMSSIEGSVKLDKSDRLELHITLFSGSIEYHTENINDQKIREKCINLLQLIYAAHNRSRPLSLSLSLILAALGILFILLPALETLYLVIVSIFLG